jgi:hypothetical protein
MAFLERLLYDMFAYDCCIPGGLPGEESLECPHCGEALTVSVDNPEGEESYQCCQCECYFDINWRSGQITYNPAEITLSIELEFTGPEDQP